HRAIDAIALTFLAHAALVQWTTRFAARRVIADDQRVLVEHRALEACIRAHVLAHLLAHPARIAVCGKRVEQNPEPFPGAESELDDCTGQFADRRKEADKSETGPQCDQTPDQMLGRLAGDLVDTPGLAIETHARTARALDLALDP